MAAVKDEAVGFVELDGRVDFGEPVILAHLVDFPVDDRRWGWGLKDRVDLGVNVRLIGTCLSLR
jgi:hypothetical protein